jgi:hypothetical protein
VPNKNSTNLISVRNENGEYEYIRVDPRIRVYIYKLENYIRFPEESKLLEEYPERFTSE